MGRGVKKECERITGQLCRDLFTQEQKKCNLRLFDSESPRNEVGETRAIYFIANCKLGTKNCRKNKRTFTLILNTKILLSKKP